MSSPTSPLYQYSTHASISIDGQCQHKSTPRDLKSALKLIAKLRAEKESLKQALGEILKKRDELYAEVVSLHSKLDKVSSTTKNLLSEEGAKLVSKAKESVSVYSLFKKHIGCATLFHQQIVSSNPPTLNLLKFSSKLVSRLNRTDDTRMTQLNDELRATIQRSAKLLNLPLKNSIEFKLDHAEKMIHQIDSFSEPSILTNNL